MSDKYELSNFALLAKGIFGNRWHYFGHHVANFTPFIRSVYAACIDLRVIDEDAPLAMLREIKNIGGRKNYEPHYDQLLQKLAEILVMRQVVKMPWPQETSFEIEAGVSGNAKRIDLVVTLPEGKKFGFEVKAPKYTPHARQREGKSFQFPAQIGKQPLGIQNPSDHKAVLPRDKTVRGFLRSAEAKFEVFSARHDFCGTLVIVWDDWMSEVVEPLFAREAGLLTPCTSEVFGNIDAVLILRHLTHFAEAAGANNVSDGRGDPMSMTEARENPNIIKEMSDIELPEFIKNGFNAVPLDHTPTM
ncbi:MAG: hypothetical protein V7727_17485 [Sneathiella sp.]